MKLPDGTLVHVRMSKRGAKITPADLAAIQDMRDLIFNHDRGTTMRTLEGHRVNPANDKLKIEVQDGPGSGGASHLYHITGFNSSTNPSDPWTARHGAPAEHSTILFQNGPIAEVGVNGLTHEALLAVLIDRLECFQAGQFANGFNGDALIHLQAAQNALQARTKERMARNVEGTHQL